MKARNYQIIFREIGTLISLMSLIFMVPFFVGIIYFEWYSSLGFLFSAIIALGLGQFLKQLFKNANEPMYFHGFVIAALAWLAMVVVGGLPLYLISWLTPEEVYNSFIPAGQNYSSSLLFFRNYLHCIFESMSAYTTTGLTMAVHEPSVGKTILFYRCFAQWIGGAWGGTVGGIKIYRAILIFKGIGWYIQKSFLSPNTIKTMKFDYKVLLPDEVNESLANAGFFTIVFFLILMGSTLLTTYFLPENWTFFDALFESVAAQSTAGLSVGITDPSMSPVVEIIYILQMWFGRLEIFPVLALFRFAFFGSSPKIK